MAIRNEGRREADERQNCSRVGRFKMQMKWKNRICRISIAICKESRQDELKFVSSTERLYSHDRSLVLVLVLLLLFGDNGGQNRARADCKALSETGLVKTEFAPAIRKASTSS